MTFVDISPSLRAVCRPDHPIRFESHDRSSVSPDTLLLLRPSGVNAEPYEKTKLVIFLSPGGSPARYSHQYWAPVVANHFPPTSPFVQSQSLGYSLLPQGVQFSPPPRAPPLTQPPLARQRSGDAGGDYTLLPQTPKLERKRSRKGAREVGRSHSRYRVIPALISLRTYNGGAECCATLRKSLLNRATERRRPRARAGFRE